MVNIKNNKKIINLLGNGEFSFVDNDNIKYDQNDIYKCITNIFDFIIDYLKSNMIPLDLNAKLANQKIKFLINHPDSRVSNLAMTIDYMKKNLSINPHDLHSENIMLNKKTNTLVLSDVGYFDIK